MCMWRELGTGIRQPSLLMYSAVELLLSPAQLLLLLLLLPCLSEEIPRCKEMMPGQAARMQQMEELQWHEALRDLFLHELFCSCPRADEQKRLEAAPLRARARCAFPQHNPNVGVGETAPTSRPAGQILLSLGKLHQETQFVKCWRTGALVDFHIHV